METITLTENELDEIISSSWDAGNYGEAPRSAKGVIKTLKYERSRFENLMRVVKELALNNVEHDEPKLVCIPNGRGCSGYRISVCCEPKSEVAISNLETKFNIVDGGKFMKDGKIFKRFYVKGV